MMTEQAMVRVLVVDDHALVRFGIGHYLRAYDWVQTVGECENGSDAVEFCATHDVDVVLMDMVMPVMDGSEATRRIMSLGKPISVIALTSFHEQDLVEKALKSGANSYLLKNVSADELASAIQAAHAGRSTLAPEATKALIDAARRGHAVGGDLTPRELDILGLLATGASNQEIAQSMSITVRTVTFHLTNIFTKLDAKNRVEAVAIALERRLIENLPK